MEPLRLKVRQPVADAIECWDDDGDLQGVEELHLRNASAGTTATFVSSRSQHHRESLQSKLSSRSDLDDEGDWQLHLPANDQESTTSAIADAKSRGIPIPDNVPASALLGGTIRRLGGKKIKNAIGDDWGDDLELPKPEEGLKLRVNDGKDFPESLRQLSTAAPPMFSQMPGTASTKGNMSFLERLQKFNKSQPAMSATSRFEDVAEEPDKASTIRVPKHRAPAPIPFFDGSPTKPPKTKQVESFDDDLELPEDGELKLSTHRDDPKTPASQHMDDFDFDWTDGSAGSFGTSHSIARRSGRSNRSSSVSARSPSVFSPSLSSCLTAESEDEGLEGLVLPEGPLKLQDALARRMADLTPDESEDKKLAPSPLPTPNDDFFTGIEIGDGDVFVSGKLTLNRNIKHKTQRQSSPKRPAMSLTFTNKPVTQTNTRIPKPSGADRTRSKLEPVLENSGQSPQLRRAKSRIENHSAHSSITNIPTAIASTSNPTGPSTPSRRGLAPRASRETVKPEPTTNTALLLKAKRSLPLLGGRDPTSPSRIHPQPPAPRPTSRSSKPLRSTPQLRPKTPVDRSESSLATARRVAAQQAPAAGTVPSRPVSTKPSRTFHRPTSSENSNDSVSSSTRSISRASNTHRQLSPTRRNVAPDSLAKAAATKQQLTKPLRRRAYGDGNELDGFDDLPTSSTAESKYRKAPAVGKLPSSPALRKAYSHSNVLQQSISRPSSTVPPPSPMKPDTTHLPRFAQSTAASVARKQRAGAISPEALRRPAVQPEPTSTLAATYRLQPPPQGGARHATKRSPKPQQKPHLIKQLGSNAHHTKSIKGMQYNPTLFRWEGNEHALAPFDVPPVSPRRATPTPSTKPALIANVGSTKGVQVVGGMVFDPQRMCWLKLAPQSNQQVPLRGGAASLATEEDEDDPFAGFEDLEDNAAKPTAAGVGPIKDLGSDEEWPVSEEFDVGPDFVRRQRAEEVKWRRRMDGWRAILDGPRFEDGARWALRRLVMRENEGRAVS